MTQQCFPTQLNQKTVRRDWTSSEFSEESPSLGGRVRGVADTRTSWFPHSHGRLRESKRKSCSLQEPFKSVQAALCLFYTCPHLLWFALRKSWLYNSVFEDFIFSTYSITMKHILQIIGKSHAKCVCVCVVFISQWIIVFCAIFVWLNHLFVSKEKHYGDWNRSP